VSVEQCTHPLAELGVRSARLVEECVALVRREVERGIEDAVGLLKALATEACQPALPS
jgi:hypothetical protein